MSSDPWRIYDLLIERACSEELVRHVLLGLNWTLVEARATGLCFSPVAPRTLEWPGTLRGRSSSELAGWLRSSDEVAASVGLAVVNAMLNGPANELVNRAVPLVNAAPPHLAVFRHFTKLVEGANVVVIGRYPGLELLWSQEDYLCLERRPLPGTVPESAAADVLPGADWVFVTASSLANHSLPELLELSHRARVVLMGPSLPWLAEWADFGVDYVAGVGVYDPARLLQIAAEGGGTRIFESAVGYRLLEI